MELAMRCRDSGGGQCVLVFCGSEWTAGAFLVLPTIAFHGDVRQRLFQLDEEPRQKVACFGGCYSWRCASSDGTEATRHVLLVGWPPCSRWVVEHVGLVPVRLNCCLSSSG